MPRGDNDGTAPGQRREESRTTPSAHPTRGKLPQELQKIVDREDDFFDSLYEGQYVHHQDGFSISSLTAELPTRPTPNSDMPLTPPELEQFS